MEREIKIFFKLHGKIRSCVLLADQVVDMPNRMELDNNLQYEYQKYISKKKKFLAMKARQV